MQRALNIRVRDSVYDPRGSGDTIQFRKPRSGSPLYRVHLFLEGDDIVYVKQATYRLHQTFANPVRTVARTPSNPNCMLQIWTWGLFEVEVTVEDKSGGRTTLTHALSYGREIEKAQPGKFRAVS